MWDVKACAVCFSTGVKLFNLNDGDLRQQFNIVSGLTPSCYIAGLHLKKKKSSNNERRIPIINDIETHPRSSVPGYLCVECSAYVRKFIKFRDKCQRAQYAWECLLIQNNEIKKSDLKLINLEELNLKPALAYVDLDKISYKQEIFKWTKACRQQVTPVEFIPIAHYSTLTKEDTFETAATTVQSETEIKTETSIKLDDERDDEIKQSDSTITIEVPNTESFDSNFNEDDSHFIDDDESDETKPLSSFKHDVNGEKFNDEFATIIPISVKEAKAVMEIKKRFKSGKLKCACGWSTSREQDLDFHNRRHDKYINGNFHCEICDYYYKTNYLLQTHMSDKHMYKYLCKKCNDVNYDRSTAKQHFLNHLHKIDKKISLLPKKIVKKKSQQKLEQKKESEYVNGVKRVPKEYLAFETIKPEEQYSMVELRKTMKNYLQANFRCELCYKGFRCTSTFSKHMVKHDPEISGKFQCDICKLFFSDTRKIYKHINTNHMTKYSCKLCEYCTANRSQAILHTKWHQNITYDCPHCDRKFLKVSTQLTHLRLKHPSMFICKICGHSFVSSQGLYCHNQQSHTKEEIDASENREKDKKDPNYCEDCDLQFMNSDAYATHLGSSSKHVQINEAFLKDRFMERVDAKMARNVRGRPRRRQHHADIINNGISIAQNCDLCGVMLATDVEANKHYKTEHPGSDYLKRYMCDVCGHATKQYANLLAHMRTHTNEKPYSCPHCDRRFSMPSNRDRHIVVHTGEKRYECQHCSRRFTQSSAVKLHIQTVHMKIPYAPWDKKKRKRKKEMEPTTADLSIVAPQTTSCIVQQAEHKLIIENPTEYINAYITYTDE